VGLSGITYGSHYCSVDNRHEATTLACSHLESGVRTCNIRGPFRPREIAYFRTPSVITVSPGSQNTHGVANGRPDQCSAQVRLDARAQSLVTTCQDNGFMVPTFAGGVWPFLTVSDHDYAGR
jgi:hypothetical protein